MNEAPATWEVIHGDSLLVLPTLAAASVDAVVTDPPYGLEFMGKEWDAPWKHRGKRPASAGMSAGGFAAGNGYRDRETPAYGRAWSNKRCLDCGHIASGGSPCKCENPRWTVERGNTAAPMQAYQAWCEPWARECLRVAKPGAHLLAFGGPRTIHRLGCAIEDAGWEVRDMLCWLQGQGFPKNLNVSAAIRSGLPADALCACAPRSTRTVAGSQVGCQSSGGSDDGRLPLGVGRDQGAAPSQSDARGRTHDGPRAGGLDAAQANSGAGAGTVPHASADSERRDAAPARDRSGESESSGTGTSTSPASRTEPRRKALGTPDTYDSERGSASWDANIPRCADCGKMRVPDGLGTALKPSWEGIILARKPLIGTVAANHAKHGVGGLRIDECRIGVEARSYTPKGIAPGQNNAVGKPWDGGAQGSVEVEGRWPANVVLDEDAAALVDAQSGGVGGAGGATSGCNALGQSSGWNAHENRPTAIERIADSGGASRFFYTAKASRSEREAGLRGEEREGPSAAYGMKAVNLTRKDGGPNVVRPVRNTHPTVKPVDLMRWLVRLVTPVGGHVLDPFTGSGTTGVACVEEGLRFTGIEREAEYVAIARARIAATAPVLPLSPHPGASGDRLTP